MTLGLGSYTALVPNHKSGSQSPGQTKQSPNKGCSIQQTSKPIHTSSHSTPPAPSSQYHTTIPPTPTNKHKPRLPSPSTSHPQTGTATRAAPATHMTSGHQTNKRLATDQLNPPTTHEKPTLSPYDQHNLEHPRNSILPPKNLQNQPPQNAKRENLNQNTAPKMGAENCIKTGTV